MHANVQKSSLSQREKQAQLTLIETMALNSLLTGLEPRIGQIIRASNPNDLLEAQVRIRRELQLSYSETQKVNRPNLPRPNQPIRRPNNFQPPKCFSCGRIGHIANECRAPQRPNNYQNNLPRPSYYQNPPMSSSGQTSRPSEQQRPQFTPNQNNFQPRPSVIQRNPNYSHQRHQTHFVDYSYDYPNENPQYEYDQYDYQTEDNYYNQYTPEYNQSFNQPTNQFEFTDHQDFQTHPDQNHPPVQSTQITDMSHIQSQIQALNLDDMNPNLNFPEQKFL